MTDGKCGLPRGSRKRVIADRLGAAVSPGSSAPFLVEKMRISAINIFCRCGSGLLCRQRRNGALIMKKIGIVMGSDSDLKVVEKAAETLREYGVPFEMHVFSAHRTPVEAANFAKSARENGFGAIIAAAGKAAHLAGAIAANTTLPVIGIPIKSSNLDGIDALLSTVQMPSGIPVATVAIDGAVNAALLCIQILSVTDEGLAEKITAARAAAAQKVLEKNKAIEEKFNI